MGTELTATLADPDGNITGLTWQWAGADSKNGGFKDIGVDYNDAATSVTYTPGSGDVGKFLKVTASYTDGEGPSKAAEAVSEYSVRAVPEANVKPTFSRTKTTRKIEENVQSDTPIGGPVTATDTGDILFYTLSGADAAAFAIDERSGQLKTSAELDYEAEKNSYTVTVEVSDHKDDKHVHNNEIDDIITVTISVTNVDEEGTVTLSSTQPQEGTRLTAALTDPDGGLSNITWQWANADSADGDFTPIGVAKLATFTPSTSDVGKYLKATASYRDGESSGGKTAEFVSVNPVQKAGEGNSPPVFPYANDTREVAENTEDDQEVDKDVGKPITAAAGDMLTYTLGGTDAAAFTIDPTTGQLRTRATLDYETRDRYSVKVTATNPSGVSDSITVSIHVTNADDEGTVTLTPTQPQLGTELVATLTDPDGDITRVTWQWEISPDGKSNWEDISATTSATFTPGSGDVGKYLKATASYTDSTGSDKTAEVVAASAVRAVGEPPSDSIAPAFAGNTATRSVAENTATAANIGLPVTATDTDSGDTLTYSLSGRDAASFAIIASSGQLQTKTALDYETKSRYSVTVTATDLSGASDSIKVTITVTNVNEASVVTGPTAQSYPENGTGTVASYRATDPEGQSVTWSLSGTDSGDFSISTTGKLTFKTPPDYEAPADANRDNNYLVRVRADDGSHIGDLGGDG